MSQNPTPTQKTPTDLPTSAQIEHLITLLTSVLEASKSSDMQQTIESFVTMLNEAISAMDRVTGDLQRILPAAEATERMEERLDRMEKLMLQMSATTRGLHNAMMGPIIPASSHGGS